MVWGMALPKGFGEFWPDGDFEGWTDSLKGHFLESMPASQQAPFGEGPRGALRYMGYAVDKFVKESGTVSASEKPPLSPIEPHEPPRHFDTQKTYDQLGALVMLSDKILATDEAFKAIVERLEPGVHQFFPVEIRMPKNKVFPDPYYIMVIGGYRESFSAEDSAAGSFNERRPGFCYHDTSKKGTAGLAFARSRFAGAHLWRERAFREELTCMSDELVGEIAAAGLRIPAHYQMREV
ncbi:hypothetical protein GCM10011371_11940 [Novosphingobium marinum]|uniref:Immunity MXAN-0049 protein domain-containing protein n=1 Tax=Novosphingobium marinum TaxID=1514948 RepID=A0A7Y9XXX6_9SPHN|nr:DUF1629 domain-containing protein [Novosphingobium marinum]NYH95303.1 hypothetical protein [Novosphingobium marinum]GGC25971.1 hypothetical protein GCM10011371_11940 [Novosphingobium marinum]